MHTLSVGDQVWLQHISLYVSKVHCRGGSQTARYGFYKIKRWEDFRQYIISKRHGICERCNNAGWILHHKQYINDININDESIVWGEDNIELLCGDCHQKEHHGSDTTAEGCEFNAEGELIGIPRK